MITLADEKIFYTIQGEGKFVGYPTIFVRLSKCNLRCAWKNPDGSITRCDTPHTSFDPEINTTTIEALARDILKFDCSHVCISGGEPYFQKSLPALIDRLVEANRYISLETNGTIYRQSKASYISISPKLKTSSYDPTYGENHEKHRLNYDSLVKFITNHSCQFKFVANNENDIDEIFEIRWNLLKMCHIDISDMIWLMPQGTHVHQLNERLEWVAEACKKHKWKMTDRLHIRIWNQKKGV